VNTAAFSKIRWFLRLCALGILFVLFVQLFPGDVTLFQLLQSFLIQTLIGALFLFGFAYWLKEKLSTASFALVAIIVLVTAFPYYWPLGLYSVEEADLTIGHYNLWHQNERPSEAIKAIINQNADIIGIQELNIAWTDDLAVLEQTHPYSFTVPLDTCCYGIGLYSKYPIIFQESIEVDKAPQLEVEVNINGRRVKLFYMHMRPPAFPDQSQSRNTQLKLIGQKAARTYSDWLLFGDFNIVPWASQYKEMLETSGGKDARRGFYATFPSDFLPLIPIDHMVHSQEMECTRFDSFTLEGSDHKGISAGFRFL
jgi:endonuclease/exonuclease/phosphatase (EEP) superfamily protein YafD